MFEAPTGINNRKKAPLFHLSSSLDHRLLSPYAFLPFLTIIALSAHKVSSSSLCSPVSFDQISLDPLLHTYLCPPALSHAFDLGIVLWFRVALVHLCVSICTSSLSFLTSHQPRHLAMNQEELQTAIMAECTKHKKQNSQNADYRCHAPNMFGTVNMERTIDLRLSWSER